jgi:integrase
VFRLSIDREYIGKQSPPTGWFHFRIRVEGLAKTGKGRDQPGDNFWVPPFTEDGKPMTRKMAYLRAQQREAEMRLKAQEDQLAKTVPSTMTFEQFVDKWLADWVAFREESTKAHYQSVSSALKAALGDLLLTEIDASTLQDYCVACASGTKRKKLTGGKYSRPLSERSIYDHYAVIRAILSKAKEWNKIKENPADVPCPVSITTTATRPTLEDDDIPTFIALAGNSGYHDELMVSLGLGLRRGEVFGLKWKDVNFTEKSVLIRREVTAKRWLLERTKTKAGYRAVGMPDAIASILTDRWLEAERRDPEDLIFCELSGKTVETAKYDEVALVKSLDFKAFYKAMHEIRAALNIPRLVPHSLRHAYATHLLRNGADLAAVAASIGHEKASTTLNIYAHAVKDRPNAQLAQRMEQVLSRRPKTEAQ